MFFCFLLGFLRGKYKFIKFSPGFISVFAIIASMRKNKQLLLLVFVFCRTAEKCVFIGVFEYF